MKFVGLLIMLFSIWSQAQVSVVRFSHQVAYSTKGSIICNYATEPSSGIRFDFDKANSDGIDRAVASFIRSGIEQKPHHLATVKTDSVSADVFSYLISGEISGVRYTLTMNTSTKKGLGKHFKGQGMPGIDLICKYTK